MRLHYKKLLLAEGGGNIFPFSARVTAIPTIPQAIASLTSRQYLWWRGRGFDMKVGEQTYPCQYPARDFDDYAKIRLRSLASQPRETGSLRGVSRLLTSDGLVEFRLSHERRKSQDEGSNPYSRIYAGWIIGLVVGALAQIDHLRSRLAWDAVEFGLEIEILTQSPTLLRWTDEWESGALMNHSGSILLPRYSVGPQSEFNELIRAFLIDLSNTAGTPWDYPCEVPWQGLLSSQ
jgi:hypothetical protein